MASTKTLAEMMNITRELANQETNSGSVDFVSDPELRRRLNEWLSALYDKLVSSYPQEYYTKDGGDSSIVSGTKEYSLPSDFMTLISVTLKDGDIFHEPEIWLPSNMATLRRAEALGQGNSVYNIRYRLQNAKIVFRPAPLSSTWKYNLQYVPTFTNFLTDGTQDSSTFDGVNGWEKWACYGAAIECINKEEQDPGTLPDSWAKIDARINALAAKRDQGKVERIRDTLGASEYRTRRRVFERLPPA